MSASGTLVYLSGGPARSERLEAAGGAVTWTDYLMAGGRLVGQKVTRPDTSTATRYFVLDHLGSVAVVTDEVGAVVERLSFDAWGKRRNPDGSPDPAGALTSQAVRGFTGHEMLDELDLVHMNGRIYEPQLGRFLSADPMVEDLASTQGLNRYTYVLNRPLSLTDPTGHWSLWKVFKKSPIAKAVVAIAAAVTMQYELMPLMLAQVGISGVAGGFASAVAGGMVGGAVATGTVKGALIGGATAAAFYGVAQAIPDAAFGSAQHFGQMAGHAAVGCASTAAQGGSCGSGALAAGFGAAVAPQLAGLDRVSATIASAIAGGIGSKLGGGKFANGAVTGAFGYLFSQAMAGGERASTTGEGPGVQLACAGDECPSGIVLQGKASNYSDWFNGRKTSNGEIFSQDKLTAAVFPGDAPLGSTATVTLDSDPSRSVQVRINDHGLYRMQDGVRVRIEDRVIDLSKAAMQALTGHRNDLQSVTVVVH